MRRMLFVLTVVLLGSHVQTAMATPTTNFWAPSTPLVQPWRVLHLTYDTYFQSSAAYPVDAGLTIGVLPGKSLQGEFGFDLFYPTSSSDGPVAFPVQLNGKIGLPEGALFKGSPAWSFGAYAVGFEADVTDYNLLYGVVGKTFPKAGMLSVGGYYGGNENLFHSSTGEVHRSGLLAGWASPSVDVPVIDHLAFTWDVQTGENVLGATGGGVYFYITPAVDVLTGPVFFLDPDLQPGHTDWMWSIQLDADIPFLSK